MKKNKASVKVIGKVVTNEELNEINRMRLNLEMIKDIPCTTGSYPMSITEKGKTRLRTPWQEGWNECLMDYQKRLYKILDKNYGKYSKDLLILHLLDVGWMIDGKFHLNMNDTFDWACADCEEVPFDKLHQVIEMFRRFGDGGLTYWVAEKRGYDPSKDIPEARKAVKDIRKIMKPKKFWFF